MALDDILLEAEDKMTKTEDVVQKEFAGVRTGKASPALVENILVEVYGSQMRIRELAGITTPEPHVRRDAIEALKKESKAGKITEDDLEHAEKEVQKLTDDYIGKIDAHLQHKEKEIMTV